jgi:hypothetical protein
MGNNQCDGWCYILRRPIEQESIRNSSCQPGYGKALLTGACMTFNLHLLQGDLPLPWYCHERSWINRIHLHSSEMTIGVTGIRTIQSKATSGRVLIDNWLMISIVLGRWVFIVSKKHEQIEMMRLRVTYRVESESYRVPKYIYLPPIYIWRQHAVLGQKQSYKIECVYQS